MVPDFNNLEPFSGCRTPTETSFLLQIQHTRRINALAQSRNKPDIYWI